MFSKLACKLFLNCSFECYHGQTNVVDAQINEKYILDLLVFLIFLIFKINSFNKNFQYYKY